MTDFDPLRARMVSDHIQARGVSDIRVLDAMRSVPREAFVDPDLAEFAYEDTPLPIAVGQTISQPYMVAQMLENAQLPACLMHLRHPRRDALRKELSWPRLERAIGVVYRPETELESHYFQAILPSQFDEYVWFDQSSAVAALAPEVPAGLPDTYPFGL